MRWTGGSAARPCRHSQDRRARRLRVAGRLASFGSCHSGSTKRPHSFSAIGRRSRSLTNDGDALVSEATLSEVAARVVTTSSRVSRSPGRARVDTGRAESPPAGSGNTVRLLRDHTGADLLLCLAEDLTAASAPDQRSEWRWSTRSSTNGRPRHGRRRVPRRRPACCTRAAAPPHFSMTRPRRDSRLAHDSLSCSSMRRAYACTLRKLLRGAGDGYSQSRQALDVTSDDLLASPSWRWPLALAARRRRRRPARPSQRPRLAR